MGKTANDNKLLSELQPCLIIALTLNKAIITSIWLQVHLVCHLKLDCHFAFTFVTCWDVITRTLMKQIKLHL